jgi:hypothetical protein
VKDLINKTIILRYNSSDDHYLFVGSYKIINKFAFSTTVSSDTWARISASREERENASGGSVAQAVARRHPDNVCLPGHPTH